MTSPNPTQRAFDIAAKHLLRQGERSVREPWAECAYRGSGGRRCAIGALIPNARYRAEMEGLSVWRLLHKYPNAIHVDCRGADLTVLDALQGIHDRPDPKHWPRELAALAGKYGLSFSPDVKDSRHEHLPLLREVPARQAPIRAEPPPVPVRVPGGRRFLGHRRPERPPLDGPRRRRSRLRIPHPGRGHRGL